MYFILKYNYCNTPSKFQTYNGHIIAWLPDAFSLNSHTGKEKLYGYNLLKFRKNYVTK